MREMKFARPNLHQGINTTFRLGHKWGDSLCQDLNLINLQGGSLGTGTVLNIREALIFTVTEKELQDSGCLLPEKTLDGLYRELSEIYGDKFNHWKKILVVTFRYRPIAKTDLDVVE